MMSASAHSRKGRIFKLAQEFSASVPAAQPAARKGKVVARHYDDGQAIQLQYSGAWVPTPRYGQAQGLSDDAEARTFNVRDDRFYVESFEVAGDEVEVIQHNTLSTEAAVAAALSAADEEVIQYNTLNDGETSTAMALAEDEEVIQFNRLNEEETATVSAAASWVNDEPVTASTADDETMSTQSSFEDDIKAILSGQKRYDETAKALASTTPSDDDEVPAVPSSPATPGQHQIFDTLAKGMAMAKSYDLGTLSLERSFDEFDRQLDRQQAYDKPLPLAHEASARIDRQQALSDLDYAEDLSAIAFDQPASAPPAQPNTTVPIPDESEVPTAKPSLVDAGVAQQASYISHAYQDPRSGPDWPPRPTNLHVMTVAEKERIFGRFAYEPTTGDDIRILGSWVQDNIVDVRIPQLDGKLFGGRPMTRGSIQFHRLGQQKLVALWAAWEQAGLLDRILTFQGGFVSRFIRNTADRSPRPLSNHAWGTAFDINAPQNGFGAEPALIGSPGCVRELVEIANQHGFFWGGHFRRKDGMHFELASPFTP